LKAFFSRDAVTQRLAETERAVKLAALEKPQSEADHGRLIGAAALLQSIGDSNAVVVVGSLLRSAVRIPLPPARCTSGRSANPN
jgi:hypothetical protein